jgi:hypothetical protein
MSNHSRKEVAKMTHKSIDLCGKIETVGNIYLPWVSDNNLRKAFRWSIRKLALAVGESKIDMVDPSIYSALDDFFDKLSDFLEDTCKHEAQLHHDLTRPARPTRWSDDDCDDDI